ncbi:MAG: hypothetical protein ACRDI2_18190 [Chloroflexota bacterium]
MFIFTMRGDPERRLEPLGALTEHGRICVQSESGTPEFATACGGHACAAAPTAW